VSDTADAVPSRLTSARKARGLSPAQVAAQMRIAADAVIAMEEGRYADLGPPVFARGHLRKYAALLGVPVDEVLADYDGSPSRAAESTLIPPASAHTPVGGHGGRQVARAAGLAVVLIALAAAAAAGWWYWQSRGRAAPGPDGARAAEGMRMEASEISEASPQDMVPPSGGASTVGGRLGLEFSGPCWLEVYDADGTRLAFQLAEAGSTLAFDGPAPWRVVIGNADSVRLTLDGDGLDIPASMRVREAALVTIADDGTVAPAPGDGDAQ
jgi:cytoskeleton protein RodZ